jgi:hypothetical protein
MIARLSRLYSHRMFHQWSWPATDKSDQYNNERVTYVTCLKTGQVRLCCPVNMRILSAREDRQVRKDPARYLEIQKQVDLARNEKLNIAWKALEAHPEAMRRRNASLVTMASSVV